MYVTLNVLLLGGWQRPQFVLHWVAYCSHFCENKWSPILETSIGEHIIIEVPSWVTALWAGVASSFPCQALPTTSPHFYPHHHDRHPFTAWLTKRRRREAFTTTPRTRVLQCCRRDLSTTTTAPRSIQFVNSPYRHVLLVAHPAIFHGFAENRAESPTVALFHIWSLITPITLPGSP